jgi:hypothetical protein
VFIVVSSVVIMHRHYSRIEGNDAGFLLKQIKRKELTAPTCRLE